MSSENIHSSLAQLSIERSTSNSEDWDRSTIRGETTGDMQPNSVTFPAEDGAAEERDAPARAAGKLNRKLSDLLRLHAEKGTEFACSPEEASRLADVLGQWVRSYSPFTSGYHLRPSGCDLAMLITAFLLLFNA